MSVGELITRLSACDRDAVVTLGTAPGVLRTLTPTVNGFVIMDAEPGDLELRLGGRNPGLYLEGKRVS